jgi:hypothetical protein
MPDPGRTRSCSRPQQRSCLCSKPDTTIVGKSHGSGVCMWLLWSMSMARVFGQLLKSYFCGTKICVLQRESRVKLNYQVAIKALHRERMRFTTIASMIASCPSNKEITYVSALTIVPVADVLRREGPISVKRRSSFRPESEFLLFAHTCGRMVC